MFRIADPKWHFTRLEQRETGLAEHDVAADAALVELAVIARVRFARPVAEGEELEGGEEGVDGGVGGAG
jgi:hypothetical protein